jgi:hypothetical protein
VRGPYGVFEREWARPDTTAMATAPNGGRRRGRVKGEVGGGGGGGRGGVGSWGSGCCIGPNGGSKRENTLPTSMERRMDAGQKYSKKVFVGPRPVPRIVWAGHGTKV